MHPTRCARPVSANYFGISFDRYAAVMVPVYLVSLVVTLGVMWFAYRRAVSARYSMDGDDRYWRGAVVLGDEQHAWGTSGRAVD